MRAEPALLRSGNGCGLNALSLAGLALSVLFTTTSCVSKTKAKVQAREAFVAGQQQALARLQQMQGPSVSFVGPVRNNVVPWTQDLTVARAIVAAGYVGARDPRTIIVVRNGQAFTIDPNQLLSGEDMPLESGDLVQISE